MYGFLLSLQFLTILPINLKKSPKQRDFSVAITFFPIIGAIIGLILVGCNHLLAFILPPNIINLFLIVLMTFLTGALHLDGLADTIDGIASSKPKEKMLEIMKDSRIGVMGVIAIIFSILTKLTLINQLSILDLPVILVTMLLLSRWSMVFIMYVFSYARKEGKAKMFFDGTNFTVLLIASIITFVPLLYYFRVQGLYFIIIALLASLLSGLYLNKKLGGLTGDTIGAVSELNEICILLAAYLIG